MIISILNLVYLFCYLTFSWEHDKKIYEVAETKPESNIEIVSLLLHRKKSFH